MPSSGIRASSSTLGPVRSILIRGASKPVLPLQIAGRPPLINYAPGSIKLSILIPTLASRAAMLGKLLRTLQRQIKSLGQSPEVEVLIFEDNREHTVGAKRNRLLSEATGDFVVFIDDDDEISDDYVFRMYTAILDHPAIDCIGMMGVITINGQNPRQVNYSLRNESLFESGGVYYRPPGHLTPIRRAVAQRYLYPEKNFGEDSDWAVAILNDHALKSEFFIDKVLYHYKFNSSTTETQGLASRPTQKTFHIVILSAEASNLRNCIKSILQKEPMLPRDRIIVVDDGAKAECHAEFPGITWVQGMKPFVFSRNANIGIRAAGDDVILMNDDARLISKFGFTSLSFASRSRPDVGVCSAAISGVVGNPNQRPWLVTAGMRNEPVSLAFVSVYIPSDTIQNIGFLDERFVGYGFEDNDYCLRCRKSGRSLAIYDGCVVEHGMDGHSTYRIKPEIRALIERSRDLYREKWGAEAGL